MLLIIGCSSESHQIETVAYDYCLATANYDIDRAEAFCTEETRRTTLTTARRLLSLVDSSFIASDTPAHIDITAVRQTSDTTAIAVYHKTTPIKDFSDTLELRKRNGQWLAHM